MANNIEKLKLILDRISNLKSEDKAELLEELEQLEKSASKKDFKLSRLLKDKKIAINVLNETISELEKANENLKLQEEELRKQKTIIEEKSNHLSENLKKLEQSYHELEQFAYIASHDLKSPLRTISNFAQLLKKRYGAKLDEEAQGFIDFIVSGTIQMHEVICDSLEYAQADNNQEKFIEADVEEVMTMVKMNLKEEIDSTSATINYGPLPTIIANKTNLIQLFQNLIGNAIKFSKGTAPQIDICWKKKGSGVQFSIKDNGIGIAKEYQEKIFEPFQRIEKNQSSGSGIGLAICKKIVRMHGGEISCESVPNEGATFYFSLYPQENGKQGGKPTWHQNSDPTA